MTAYGFSFQSYAQSMTPASVFATIVTPVSVERTVDLNLNSTSRESRDIAIFSRTDIHVNKNIISTYSDNIELVKLMIKGEDLSSFALTLPLSPLFFKHITGNEILMVNSFICDIGTTGALSAGKKKLTIRAHFSFGSTPQVAGIYFSPDPLEITVNYN